MRNSLGTRTAAERALDEVRATLAGSLAAQRSLVTGRRVHVDEIAGHDRSGVAGKEAFA